MSTSCIMTVSCGFFDKMPNGSLNPSSQLTLKGMKIVTKDNLSACREAIEDFCLTQGIQIIDDSSLKETKNDRK